MNGDFPAEQNYSCMFMLCCDIFKLESMSQHHNMNINVLPGLPFMDMCFP